MRDGIQKVGEGGRDNIGKVQYRKRPQKADFSGEPSKKFRRNFLKS